MVRIYGTNRKEKERRLRQIIYDLKRDPRNDRCFFLRSDPRTEFHHIIPKSQRPDLIDCEENLLPISRRAHNIITHGTWAEMKQLPKIDKYLEKMCKLDQQYYNIFCTNRKINADD
jgi:DTW domain-containing protein YfiP